MPPGKRQSYSPSKMEAALTEVREGRMSLREAEEAFGVPKSTIRDNVSKETLTPIGRPTELTAEEETRILEYAEVAMSNHVKPL